MNLNKMRGNGQPQKKRSGVRLLLSMLVIMSVVFLLTACSISVGDIGFEITSIDNDGNVTATVTLSNINRDNFLEADNHLDSISIYYAYTEAKAAALAYYAGINPGGSVNVFTHEYDGFCSVNISGEENNAFKTDATAPTSFTKQLSFKLPAEAKEKNIAFLVVLSGSDSDDGWGSSGEASSVIFNYTWNIVVTEVTEVSLDKTEAQNIDVGGMVSFTASFQPNDATDRTVLWSVGGANAGAVKLYSDETCNNEVGVEATETQTVYAKGISAGLATVTATSNSDSTKSASCNVTVNKADPTAPTGLTATYGQTLANVTLPDGWTWADSAQSVGSVVSPAATFKANFAGDDNHNAASNVDVTVTVGKANAVAATVTANSRTYDGTEKPLVTVTGAPTGGEMQYALGTATEATEQYTTSIPTATDVGTYYVWYKVVGDDNHEDSEAASVTSKIRGEISATVTFKVVNGSWNEGEGDAATENMTVTLTSYEGDELKLTADDIPAVGSKPNDTYKAGSWDVEPNATTAITEDTTYTYTYAEKDSISVTVNFKVVNGFWDDETTTDKTVTLTGYEGDTLKLTAEQIPAVGGKPDDIYKEGNWDVTPSVETEITEDTTYTYTYAKKDSISKTVTFKVVNGLWDDETTTDKTVILTGYEGDTLKLSAEQIPAVGEKPNTDYNVGKWNITPSVNTEITSDITYTYTYSKVEKYEYTNTEGADGIWTKGSSEELKFVFKCTLDDKETIKHFTGILVDGKFVPIENYSYEAGSVIVKLKSSYLETLSVGEHTLTVQFDDGDDVTVRFTIKDKATDEKKTDTNSDNNKAEVKPGEKSETTTTKTDKPNTGDTVNLQLIFLVMILSMCDIFALCFLRSKIEEKKRKR